MPLLKDGSEPAYVMRARAMSKKASKKKDSKADKKMPMNHKLSIAKVLKSGY